ncbi:MAG: copper resistance protein CopC, partial [Chloroflexota bacterium]|nr:copper resistance protein CopC [Chloroflexota bacterium]
GTRRAGPDTRAAPRLMPTIRAGRLAGALAVLALLLAPALPDVTGARVLGHAQLVASSPGAGAVLAESPEEIRLVFSEPLEVQVTSLDLATEDGIAVVTRVGEIDPEDPYALVLEGPELADGVYQLTWRTLSAADGHTAEGFLSFGIGEIEGEVGGGPGGSMVHTETDAAGVVGRWLTYIGLLLALGVAVFHRVVMRDGPMPARLARILGAALLVSSAATIGMAIAAGLEAGGVGEYLAGTRNGLLQLGRGVVAACGGIVLLFATPRLAGAVAAGTGLVGIVLLVMAGHAAALPGPVPILGQAVHVVGAAVWIGGIVALLVLAVRPALLSESAPPMRSLMPRFSALALVSIGLVVLTGIYSAYVQTGTLIDPGTEYGGTLLLKALFAAGALALGAVNFYDGGRMMGWLDGFRNRVTLEVTLAGAVLVLTAMLATTPPVDEPSGVAIVPIPDAFGEVTPGMTLNIIPGRPGLNRVVVTTVEGLAGSTTLELGLDRLDAGTTTRVPLIAEDMAGGGPMAGMGHGGMGALAEDGAIRWIADAIVLPPGSQWDTSVRVLSSADQTELSRQRFAFTLASVGIDEGRSMSLLNPATAVAALLLLGGALGVGLGIGGMPLPRSDRVASRIALVSGGATAVVVGMMIGASRLLA